MFTYYFFLFICRPAFCALATYLSRYAPRSPTTSQKRLLSCPQSLSPTCDSRSVCPSPSPMFQQLYHAVAYWEKQLLDRSPTPGADQENIAYPNEESNAGKTQPSDSSRLVSSSHSAISPARRMTVPSVHVLEYETCKVVTLDPPVYTSHTDLDDISQPENGVAADAEISASDSESEASAKEDQDQCSEQITETPYVANENEVLGTVGNVICMFYV